MTPVPLITNSGACRHLWGGDSGQLKQAHLTKGAAATAIAFFHVSYFSIETKLSQGVSFATPPLLTKKQMFMNCKTFPGSGQHKLTTQVPHRPTHLRGEGGEMHQRPLGLPVRQKGFSRPPSSQLLKIAFPDPQPYLHSSWKWVLNRVGIVGISCNCWNVFLSPARGRTWIRPRLCFHLLCPLGVKCRGGITAKLIKLKLQF